MADLLSLGGSAASVAVNPESPTAWAGLAQSVGKALGLFGGGGTPSVFQGLRINGTATAGGISGVNVTAFDQLGNSWNADPAGLNARWFNEVGSSVYDRFFPSVPNGAIAKALGSSSKNVSIAVPMQNNDPSGTTQLLALAKAAVANVIQGLSVSDSTNTDIAAPAIPATSAPAGSVDSSGAGLLVGGGTGSGGSSSVAPAPAAPIASSSNGPAWIWVALALGAYYVMSKH